MTRYVYNDEGLFIGVHDGANPPVNSTTQVPTFVEGKTPQFLNGSWVDFSLPPTVSRVRFKMLWTAQERIATKTLRSTDAVVDDFWNLLEDPQTTDVVLALPSVQQAITYTLSKIPTNVVAADQRTVRLAEILSGTLK